MVRIVKLRRKLPLENISSYNPQTNRKMLQISTVFVDKTGVANKRHLGLKIIPSRKNKKGPQCRVIARWNLCRNSRRIYPCAGALPSPPFLNFRPARAEIEVLARSLEAWKGSVPWSAFRSEFSNLRPALRGNRIVYSWSILP